jgi:hypothetical protein
MGTATNIKPVFRSKKTYLSYARKHLKIMKCKDVKYLKYFEKECREKIENREIAPEKTKIDRDYLTMYEDLLKATVARLNELS